MEVDLDEAVERGSGGSSSSDVLSRAIPARALYWLVIVYCRQEYEIEEMICLFTCVPYTEPWKLQLPQQP